MKKQKVVILAIDRAEKKFAAACKLFTHDLKLDARKILLVSKSFKSSPAYQGNESDALFEEIVVDFENIDELKKIVNQFQGIKVIVHCRMEEAIKDLQQIIPMLGKKTHVQSVKALSLSVEKSKMREAFAKMYPEITPKFCFISSPEQLTDNLVKNFSFPLIVKPNGLHSSFMVNKCDNYDTLQEIVISAFQKISDLYAREYGTGKPGLVIEEFIEGKMYSIDAYVNSKNKKFFLAPIRTITSHEVGLEGYYTYRYIVPTSLTKKQIKGAEQCSAKALDALGLTNSVAHIELYQTANGWKIIEIAPRIGGYRQDLYSEVFGINHFYNDLLIHFGKNPKIKQKIRRYGAGFTIYPLREGEITAIHGIESASHLPSVVQFGVNAKIGDPAVFNSNGGRYVVDATFANDDPEQLELDVARARELISIEVK